MAARLTEILSSNSSVIVSFAGQRFSKGGGQPATRHCILHRCRGCLCPFLRNQMHLPLQNVEKRADFVAWEAWIPVIGANPHSTSTLIETSCRFGKLRYEIMQAMAPIKRINITFQFATSRADVLRRYGEQPSPVFHSKAEGQVLAWPRQSLFLAGAQGTWRLRNRCVTV